MHAPPAPPAATRTAAPGSLQVVAVGYRVPADDFDARVHSCFERACNLSIGDSLITLGAAGIGDGPTMLRLSADAPADLRRLFTQAEAVRGRGRTLRTDRLVVDWQRAHVWRPRATRASLCAGAIGERIAHAARLCPRPAWAETCGGLPDALARACHADDGARAASLALRLIGRGEGLTPAGDDFLVGVLAGLDGLGDAAGPRAALRDILARTVMAHLRRTTAISAHGLQLAAAGHYCAWLLDLREALVTASRVGAVDAAVHRALAVGATSGAATVAGLLAGLAERAAADADARAA